MAFTMARRSVVRGRPIPAGAGIRGCSSAHSVSVVSLAKRRPSRRYCRRVISVQGMVLPSNLANPTESHPTEITHLFFGQALRCRWVRTTHMGRVDRPIGAGCFSEPLNRAVRLRRHVSLRGYDEDGLVVAAEICARRPDPERGARQEHAYKKDNGAHNLAREKA